jgi:hypothetical protein
LVEQAAHQRDFGLIFTSGFSVYVVIFRPGPECHSPLSSVCTVLQIIKIDIDYARKPSRFRIPRTKAYSLRVGPSSAEFEILFVEV